MTASATEPPTAATTTETTTAAPTPAPTPQPPTDPPVRRPPIPEQESSGITTGGGGTDWNTGTDVGVNCQTAGGFFERNSCEAAVKIREHQLFFGVLVAVVFLLCFRRCFRRWLCFFCGRSQDDRGEYRAVAERFGTYDYDNAFDDAASDDEGSYYEDEFEEDDWSSGPKPTLEMVKQERNGGLTLEEING